MSIALDPLEAARRRLAEWRIGTSSSGPETNHPFRGNQWTGGISGPGQDLHSFGRHSHSTGFRYVPGYVFPGTSQADALDVPTEGYAVASDADSAASFTDEDINPDEIEGWIADNEDLWFTPEAEEIFDKYVGIFYNPVTGVFTISGVVVVPTAEEAAILLDKYNQDAYYNIADGETSNANDDRQDDSETHSLPSLAQSYPRADAESRGRYPDREGRLRSQASQAQASAVGLDPLAVALQRTQEWRYSPDQPRDDHGRFGDGSAAPQYSGIAPNTMAQQDLPPPALQGRGRLTRAEAKAVDLYLSDAGNRAFNSKLRNPDAIVLGVGAADVAALDSAISKTSLVQDTILYRGLATDRTFPVGTRFTDKGYTSTTYQPYMAEEFAHLRSTGKSDVISESQAFGGRPQVLELSVPGGTRAMEGDEAVGEVILPRNLTFLVTGKDPTTGYIQAGLLL